MINVTIKQIDATKQIKSLFKVKGLKNKLFNSRTFSLDDFDQILKTIPQHLSENEDVILSIIISETDDAGNLKEYEFKDIELSKQDLESGIKGLIEKDILDNPDSAKDDYELEDLIQIELSDSSLIDNSVDTTKNFDGFDENIDAEDLFPESMLSKENSEIDTSLNESFDKPDEKTSDIDASNEIDLTMFEDTPITSEPVFNELPDQDEDVLSFLGDNKNNTVLPDVENNDQQVQVSQPVNTFKKNSVISLVEYANPSELSKVTENIDLEPFGIDSLKKRLGYVEDPKDEYDNELNNYIDEKINTYSLDEETNVFKLSTQQLIDQQLASLSDKYQEINEDSILDVIDKMAEEDLERIDNSTDEKIHDVRERFEKQIREKAESLSRNVELLVEQYRQQEEMKSNQQLNEFKANIERDQKNMIDQLSAQKLVEIQAIKDSTENTIVDERNTALLETKQKILNDLNIEINKIYEDTSDNYYEKAKKLQHLVAEKRSALKARRIEDQRSKERNELEARKIAQKDRELNILEQQTTATPRQVAQSVMSELAPLIGGKVNVGGTNSTSEMAELKAQVSQLQNQLAQQELHKEIKNVEEKSEKKLSRFKKRSFFLNGAVILISASVLAGVILNSQKTNADFSNNQIRTSQSSSSKPTSAINTSSSREENDKELEPISNVKKYVDAKTNTEKFDVLNSALGTSDLNSISSINASQPTTMSTLYKAILSNDGNGIRSTYLNMTGDERAYLSPVAKDAVVLAFYDVADWQHGWEVRNGY